MPINHAIAITAPGDPDVLQWAERVMPEIAADEVLLKIAAAGVNHADLLQRQGKYPPPEGVPQDIPGLEAAGDPELACVSFSAAANIPRAPAAS